jgi:hypothetical protein
LDSPSPSPSSSADSAPAPTPPVRAFRWQILIALGGFVLLVALLVAQGPQGQIGSALPAEGGAYSEALVGQISRLNPLLDDANQVDRDIDRLIYRGLVSFDGRGLPQPDLAEGWSVSADGTLYTVTLRDDAVWHDGTPVSSDDVIYTYSQFQDPDYPGPSDLVDMWQAVNIIRLDDRTVQFQLPEPFAPSSTTCPRAFSPIICCAALRSKTSSTTPSTSSRSAPARSASNGFCWTMIASRESVWRLLTTSTAVVPSWIASSSKRTIPPTRCWPPGKKEASRVCRRSKRTSSERSCLILSSTSIRRDSRRREWSSSI